MRIFLIIFSIGFFCLPAQSQWQCRSAEYKDELLASNPQIAGQVAAIESFTLKFVQGQGTTSNGSANSPQTAGPIVIPVVVHILYHNAAENLSYNQINSQIEVLNADFNRLNADTSRTPAVFMPFAASAGIRFELARVDPLGNPSSGIVRKYSSIVAYGLDDQLKSSSTGGDDAWNSDSYLNIWVVNLTQGVLGYSSVVGGPKDKDGIVVQYNAFGVNGSAAAPFNKGRTATHEVGHWLNLIHTWGDADCGDDHVADTPPQKGPNRGCPASIKITCGQGPYGDMFMNYMDFTDDGCMNLFTLGQVQRMHALFAAGGYRYAILNSTALNGAGLPDSGSPTSESQGGLLVYPNPASSSVTIQVSQFSKPGMSIQFFNELGQPVQSNTLNQQKQQVDISALRAGVYYIRSASGVTKMVKW